MIPSSRVRRTASVLVVSVLAAVYAGCVGSSEAAPVTSDTLDAVGLVDRWIESLGGLEQHWGLATAGFTLTTEIYDAASSRLRRTRPRYVQIRKDDEGLYARIERWEGDDYIAQGWTPSGKWATLNGERLSEGDKDYDEADYVGGDVHYWIALPFKLKDPGVTLHDDGTDADGRRVVRVTFGEGVGDHQDTWHYYFTGTDPWPVQVDYREAGRTNVNQTRWEDISVTDGYFFVGRRVHFDDEGRVTKVIRTSDLELNPELPRARFENP